MMSFLLVPVIMACALGGTVELLKIIKKITPGDGFPQAPISQKLKERGEHLND